MNPTRLAYLRDRAAAGTLTADEQREVFGFIQGALTVMAYAPASIGILQPLVEAAKLPECKPCEACGGRGKVQALTGSVAYPAGWSWNECYRVQRYRSGENEMTIPLTPAELRELECGSAVSAAAAREIR